MVDMRRRERGGGGLGSASHQGKVIRREDYIISVSIMILGSFHRLMRPPYPAEQDGQHHMWSRESGRGEGALRVTGDARSGRVEAE